MDCPFSLSQESKLISQNSSAELLFIDDQTTTTDLTMQLVNIQSTGNQSGLSALGEIKSQYISQLSEIVLSIWLDTILTNLLSTICFLFFLLSDISQQFLSSFSANDFQPLESDVQMYQEFILKINKINDCSNKQRLLSKFLHLKSSFDVFCARHESLNLLQENRRSTLKTSSQESIGFKNRAEAYFLKFEIAQRMG